MLFHVTWDYIDNSDEAQREGIATLGKWQPPAGAEFKGFYSFADGSGGVAIIEVDSAATLARTTAPWTTSLSFTASPIIPIEESTAISPRGLRIPGLGELAGNSATSVEEGQFVARQSPTFHGGARSGPEEWTSLSLVQKNRRFGDRSGHNGTTFAVFGAGLLHFIPAGWPRTLRPWRIMSAHALGELEVRSERPVVPGAQDRGQYLFFVGEVLEEVPGQFVETGDEERPDGDIVRPP